VKYHREPAAETKPNTATRLQNLLEITISAAWRHVQVYTRVRVPILDAQGYHTRSPDLPPARWHRTGTAGRKQAPKSFFTLEMLWVSHVRVIRRDDSPGRSKGKPGTPTRRTPFFAGSIPYATWSTRRRVRQAQRMRPEACPRAEARGGRGALRPARTNVDIDESSKGGKTRSLWTQLHLSERLAQCLSAHFLFVRALIIWPR
jgi:hypothetical protein